MNAHRLRARAGGRGCGRLAFLSVTAGTAAAVLAMAGTAGAAAPAVNLHSDAAFAVLAAAGITNTGATTVTGDTGTYPTPSETGFGSLTNFVTFAGGSDQDADAVTQTAAGDLTTAYNTAAGLSPATAHVSELGGSTLTAGVYRASTASFGLTGTLVLNAQGNPAAQFVFQTGTTLTTATDSAVVLINGASACNVFWQIGSSATFGTGTQFMGNVLAHTSISATTGASFHGRLLAETGAVTLDMNTITAPTCATTSPSPTPTPTATISPSTPTASTSSSTGATAAIPTATTLTVTPTSPGSDIVTLTASVTSLTGASAPSGTVTFYNEGVKVGSATEVNGAPAHLGVTLRAGTNAFSAVFTPSTGFASSRSALVDSGPGRSSPQLPFTGLPTIPLTALGVGLFGFGAILLRTHRRLTSATAEPNGLASHHRPSRQRAGRHRCG